MYYFCTYFDQNYLPQGLALYRSLQAHCPEFKLWVLCMDQTAYEILEKLDLPGMHPLSLEEFEHNDELLLSAKQNRSKIEYYFTCTPSLPLYIFNNWHEVDLITYLDADLFFFANPAPLFEELGDGSIAIIGHRLPPQGRYREKSGIYNVGWLTFRRDENALVCLRWWRDRCIEWCYDREEDGRYADQKYLDDWPSRFQNVIVLEHKGANVAPWNLANYHLRYLNGNTLMVDLQRLIFFHFHDLRRINPWLYNPSWKKFFVDPSMVLRRRVYAPYLQTVFDVNRQLLSINKPHPFSVNIRSQVNQQKRQLSRIPFAIWDMLLGRYIFVVNGRAF
jgi:hypothetical protein